MNYNNFYTSVSAPAKTNLNFLLLSKNGSSAVYSPRAALVFINNNEKKPNKETVKALQDSRTGKNLTKYKNLKQLLNDCWK